MPALSGNRVAPMFRDLSLNRADIATDLAIPIMAERGWAGLTLAAVAAQGNMRRQSVAQWFGSVTKFHEHIAWRYSWRWGGLLSSQTAFLYRADDVDAATVARALLPTDEDGIVFARVWLSIVEAVRSDEVVAGAVRVGEAAERDLIERHLADGQPSEVRMITALVSGLRGQLCASDPITLDDAYAACAAPRLRK